MGGSRSASRAGRAIVFGTRSSPSINHGSPTDRYDAAVLAILPYAMITGKPIRVMGGVTDLLLDDLRTGIIPIVNRQRPDLLPIEIDAAPVAAQTRGRRLGRADGPVLRRRQPVHAIDAFGSPGGKSADHAFQLSRRRSAWKGQSGRGVCVAIVACESGGGRSRSPAHRRAQQSHVLPGRQFPAVSHAVELCGGDRARIGGRNLSLQREPPVRGSPGGAWRRYLLADPIVLPLLSSSGVSCVSADAHIGRVEKTALIADWPYAQRWLDVCVNAIAG